MTELLNSLIELVLALVGVAFALLTLLKPVLPLLVWMAFWYLAVDWKRLRSTLGAGGWVVPVLVAAFVVAVRIATAESATVKMPFGPATLSPTVAAVAWTSLMAALAMICGAAQISRNAAKADLYEI